MNESFLGQLNSFIREVHDLCVIADGLRGSLLGCPPQAEVSDAAIHEGALIAAKNEIEYHLQEVRDAMSALQDVQTALSGTSLPAKR